MAAGHPETADAAARVLDGGGNAVDAGIAAMLTSFAAEPLLTGLGAGGYMLVCRPDADPVLLDFFVEAPGRGLPPARRPPLVPVEVSFGDAVQVFHAGPGSCGAYGTPAGVCAAAQRFGTIPLAELAAPAAALARAGVALNAQQAYVLEILAGIVSSTPECARWYAPRGALAREGDRLPLPDLAEAIERLGAEGDEPFYRGDVAAAVCGWVGERGGLLTAADLAAYRVIPRAPLRVRYRGRDVWTNPPPSAGGILIAYALALLDRGASPPSALELVDALSRAQGERTAEFTQRLAEPAFADAFLASRLGSTTHISVLDGNGWACSVTCSNGEGSGVVVPGTGLHLNNMLGEEDLSPFGFFSHPPGRRLPSMMAPTAVLDRDGHPLVVLGSAGSNRIRSAIVQTVVAVVDRGDRAQAAVDAPRLHPEADLVYAEPGVDADALAAAGRVVVAFRARNLFFGGVQAVERDPATGAMSGGGDPRRGGVVRVVGE